MPSTETRLNQDEILVSRVLIVEGEDSLYFWARACKIFTQNPIQVFFFQGNGNLRRFLKTFAARAEFGIVESLAIIRDAETDPQAAIDSIKSSLQNANLPVPDSPFTFAEGTPRTAFLLQPGFATDAAGNRVYLTGTLEDLCLMTVEGDPCLNCVAQYIECIEGLNEPMRWRHKMRLHAFLAGKDSYVGAKIGEAAHQGAWEWNHVALESYRSLLAAM